MLIIKNAADTTTCAITWSYVYTGGSED